MSHTDHLNTNKIFMRGNFLLAFLVILVVIIFTFMSLNFYKKQGGHKYMEEYVFAISPELIGDSIAIYMNDSLLIQRHLTKNDTLRVKKWEQNPSLLVVEYPSELVHPFTLDENGGQYMLSRRESEYILEREKD